MKDWKILFVMCCIVTALLVGCGDGRSSTPASIQGIFADAPVVGLPYTCGTQTGVTGAGGAFTCPGQSTATFSVGGITVCTATTQPIMTPLSCAQEHDASANTSTPSVLATNRFLISISTTPASSGVLTITQGELQAAAGLTLNFSTATDADLQSAINQISPGATLVDAAAAENHMIVTVNSLYAGKYGGTFGGATSGTWSITIAADGSVSGTGSDNKGETVTVAGNFVSGTKYSGTAGTSAWTGTLDTSKNPPVFSGTWADMMGPESGTFTGKKI